MLSKGAVAVIGKILLGGKHIQRLVIPIQRDNGDQIAFTSGSAGLAELDHLSAGNGSSANRRKGEGREVAIIRGGEGRDALLCKGDRSVSYVQHCFEIHAVDGKHSTTLGDLQLISNRFCNSCGFRHMTNNTTHIELAGIAEHVVVHDTVGTLVIRNLRKFESDCGSFFLITSIRCSNGCIPNANICRNRIDSAKGNLTDVIAANGEPTAQRTVGGNFRINLGGVGIQAVPGKHGGLGDEVHPTSVGNERVNEVEAIGQAGGVFHVVVGALAQVADVIGAAVEAADSGGVDFDLSVGPDAVGGEQIGHGQLDGKVYVSTVNGGSGVIGIEVGRANLTGGTGELDHVDAIAEGISGAGSGAPVKSSRHRGDAQNHDHRESDRKNLLHVFYSLSEKFVLMQVRATCFSTRQ